MKIFSKAVAVLLTFLVLSNSLSALVSAQNINISELTTLSQESEAVEDAITQDSEGFKEKVQKTIKGNKGKIITIGATLIAMGALASELYKKKFAESIIIKNIIAGRAVEDIANEYLVGSKDYDISAVLPDEWFVKLGGKQKDIDAYLLYKKEYDSNKLKCNDEEQLSQDIKRCPEPFRQPEHMAVFKRILNIYFAKHPRPGYMQGLDDYCYMIYYKFVNFGIYKISDCEEAKIYYIYEKFMDMISVYNCRTEDLPLVIRKVVFPLYYEFYNVCSSKERKEFLSMWKKFELEGGGSEQIVPIILHPRYYTCGIHNVFTFNQSIKIWDSIIVDRNMLDGCSGFNSDVVRAKVSVIINSVMLSFYTDFNKNHLQSSIFEAFMQGSFQSFCKKTGGES